jgi:hypothetical protein
MTQEQLRAETGIQCPECYGVNITRRSDRFSVGYQGFSCCECGCQWSPRVDQADNQGMR